MREIDAAAEEGEFLITSALLAGLDGRWKCMGVFVGRRWGDSCEAGMVAGVRFLEGGGVGFEEEGRRVLGDERWEGGSWGRLVAGLVEEYCGMGPVEWQGEIERRRRMRVWEEAIREEEVREGVKRKKRRVGGTLGDDVVEDDVLPHFSKIGWAEWDIPESDGVHEKAEAMDRSGELSSKTVDRWSGEGGEMGWENEWEEFEDGKEDEDHVFPPVWYTY